MGGASIARSSQQREEKSNVDDVIKINKFLLRALQRLPLETTLIKILQNNFMLETFMQYLCINNLGFNTEIEYLFDSRDYSNIEAEIILCIDDHCHPLLMKAMIESFPKYLESKYFSDWRKIEEEELLNFIDKTEILLTCTFPELVPPSTTSMLSLPTAKKISNADAKFVPFLTYTPCCSVELSTNEISQFNSSNSLSPFCRTISSEPNTIESSLRAINSDILSNLVNDLSWLPLFMATTEALPIGITISEISSNSPKYPLVFVNRHFERMAGRSRKDMVGYPGTFLQTRRTLGLPGQASRIDMLTSSIEKGTHATVAPVICSRGDGQQFENTIGIKPLFNKFRQVKFVISVQLEIEGNDLSKDSCEDIINELLLCLPNQYC